MSAEVTAPKLRWAHCCCVRAEGEASLSAASIDRSASYCVHCVRLNGAKYRLGSETWPLVDVGPLSCFQGQQIDTSSGLEFWRVQRTRSIEPNGIAFGLEVKVSVKAFVNVCFALRPTKSKEKLRGRERARERTYLPLGSMCRR